MQRYTFVWEQQELQQMDDEDDANQQEETGEAGGWTDPGAEGDQGSWGDEGGTGNAQDGGDNAASRQGWIVFCPEEGSQLGDPFASSDEAQRVASAHNHQTHPNASIQPIFNY